MNRLMNVEEAKEVCLNRNIWRCIVFVLSQWETSVTDMYIDIYTLTSTYEYFFFIFQSKPTVFNIANLPITFNFCIALQSNRKKYQKKSCTDV